MSDEGSHEIALNGKQLVFLFMSATVVAVVIFLCGVMVGRGVPVRAGSLDGAPEQTPLDPTQNLPVTPAIVSDGSAPAAAQENLSYGPLLLEDGNPSADTLLPAAEAPADMREPPALPAVAPRAATPRPAAAPKPAVAERPAAPRPDEPVTPGPSPAPRTALAPRPAAPAPAAAERTRTEPPGNGFVVQVAAVRQRAEANNIARRLSGKGYPAFVTTSGPNFRVRVGKYPNRREADSVAARLKREERFEPWVTR